MAKNNLKLIILSGGGTGGSVTPLLAMADYLKRHYIGQYQFMFFGTNNGPEKDLAAKDGIVFKKMLSGKWRRYFSWCNFSDLLIIFLAIWQSLYLLIKYKPALIISAGSFVSVPLVFAGKLLGIKSIIHQQDWRPGLANKIMSKTASLITVAMEKSLIDYGVKARWIGNPIKEIDQSELSVWQEQVRRKYQISREEKLILIVGGGTGSDWLNNLGEKNAKWLSGLGKVIHSCGKNKKFISPDGYQVLEFISHQEMLALESIATLIISRCGLGVLTEICHFRIPSLLIPLPNSHQEDNANYFIKHKAALMINEREYSETKFKSIFNDLLVNEKLRGQLQINLTKVIKPGASRAMGEIIREII